MKEARPRRLEQVPTSFSLVKVFLSQHLTFDWSLVNLPSVYINHFISFPPRPVRYMLFAWSYG